MLSSEKLSGRQDHTVSVFRDPRGPATVTYLLDRGHRHFPQSWILCFVWLIAFFIELTAKDLSLYLALMLLWDLVADSQNTLAELFPPHHKSLHTEQQDERNILSSNKQSLSEFKRLQEIFFLGQFNPVIYRPKNIAIMKQAHKLCFTVLEEKESRLLYVNMGPLWHTSSLWNTHAWRANLPYWSKRFFFWLLCAQIVFTHIKDKLTLKSLCWNLWCIMFV